MNTHEQELASLIQTQGQALKFYEKHTAYLTKKVKEHADLINWLSDRHEGFYQSPQWLELRMRALETYDAVCMCCNRRPPEVVIHVDHIKPKSLFPEMALDFDNLQVLCEACNLGKSNKIMRDYRPGKAGAA